MPTNHAGAVAANVRAELARQARSRADVARAAAIGYRSFCRRLAGEVPFDVDELSRVAAALSVPLGCLIGEAA